jgi:hypothetical protein
MRKLVEGEKKREEKGREEKRREEKRNPTCGTDRVRLTDKF